MYRENSGVRVSVPPQTGRALLPAWGWFVILALARPQSAPCQGNAHDSARQQYRWGLALKSHGDVDGALQAYGAAIQLDPRLAEAYNDRGSILLARGSVDRAIEDFNRAIRLRRRFAEAYNNRGIARLYLQDLENAAADFSRAIKCKADFAEAYSNRGNVRLHSGDLRGAVRELDKALELFERPRADSRSIAVHDPRLAKVFINRGVARCALEDFEGAIADFDMALTLDPTSAEALKNRRLAQDREKEKEAAAGRSGAHP